MGKGWDNDGGGEPRRQDDRLWVLLDKGERPSQPGDMAELRPAPEPPGAARPRRTMVVRDGDKLLISVPVGRGSALAAPLRIDQLPCAGARLVVRLASETTPCPRCVEEGLTAACDQRGGLAPEGILDAVRESVARCAALRDLTPSHGAETGSEPPPPSRTGAALRFAPPNAPHVPAGPPPDGGEMDVILII